MENAESAVLLSTLERQEIREDVGRAIAKLTSTLSTPGIFYAQLAERGKGMKISVVQMTRNIEGEERTPAGNAKREGTKRVS